MKKFYVLTLSIFCALTLVACGGNKVATGGKVTLKFSNVSLDPGIMAGDKFKEIAEAADPSLEIVLYPKNVLGDDRVVVESTRIGDLLFLAFAVFITILGFNLSMNIMAIKQSSSALGIPMLPLLVMNGVLLSLLVAPFRRRPLVLAVALFVSLTLLQALVAFITTQYGGTSNFWLVLPRGVVLNAGLGFASGLFARRR